MERGGNVGYAGGVAREFEFGALFQAVDPPTLRRRAQAAERLGFDLIGLGDSQLLFRNVYVALAVVAGATERVRLGPTVTNPITRHPSVTAQAIASLDELSGGRAILGLGTGDSSAHSIGARAVSPERLVEVARMVRALVAGEEVDFGGPRGTVRWSRRRVPIFFSGDGPRILRAAGAVADGVILGGGLDMETLARSLGQVRAGAEEAGRAFDELELWAFTRVSFGSSRDAAREPMRAGLAATAQRNFRRDPLAKGFPAEHLPALRRIVEGYAFGRHGDTDAGGNARLLEDPGLLTYMADRFALYGTPEEVREQVRQVGESGVRRLIIAITGADPDGLLEQIGEDLISKL
jgi:5,10-methylenetetrahydromethanopterin reductase